MATTKIIVLDDDPTGSQTVHSCLLLTRWDVATLKEALADSAPLFFVLTNTRGMSADAAAALTRDVCRNLKQALAGADIHPIFVSRSDSTLRGHYPVETDVMAEELGPFDAHFLVPAFFEGGRFTRNSIHYLRTDGKEIPVHETEFARDSVFGYQHSYLPDYVEEKTRGRIKAAEVKRFLLADLRAGVHKQLLGLSGNACVVVDAETQDELNRFAAEMTKYVRGGKPGAVIVGSHVPKTTSQLQELLKLPGITPIEVDVHRLPQDHAELLAEVLVRAEAIHVAGRTSVIFTSRAERGFPDQAARLAFGEQVSGFLMDVVRGLPKTLGFLISKGGITSNDVLSSGLALRTARLLGQILPGVSVVRCPPDHARFADMPVVIFPGNVGDDHALATVCQRLVTNATRA